jgi:hypothetical protein
LHKPTPILKTIGMVFVRRAHFGRSDFAGARPTVLLASVKKRAEKAHAKQLEDCSKDEVSHA